MNSKKFALKKDLLVTVASIAICFTLIFLMLDKKKVTLPQHFFLPKKLREIPLAETNHIILRTKKIKVRNMPQAYNASIIKRGDGYLMFFRYDIGNIQDRNNFHSHIGAVELDSNFEQTEKDFVKIDTGNNNSEDPRVFQMGEKTYISYAKSDFQAYDNFTPVTMNIAGINLENYKIDFATELDLNIAHVEKNWGPFEVVNKLGKPELFFQYSIYPRKILSLPDPKINHILQPIFQRGNSSRMISWENSWGTVRGGTPALKIGDQYLAFFHSSFYTKENIWYVMGAYTFESKPPFRLTSFSPYPLTFSEIYSSPRKANHKMYVCFPMSFIIEKSEDKELIHLCCGENDTAIRLITIDKEALLNHLNKFGSINNPSVELKP